MPGCASGDKVYRSGHPARWRPFVRPNQRSECAHSLEKRAFPRFLVPADSVRNLPFGHAKAVTLAQRQVEMLIGRLITDEQFRREFLNDPERTLVGLCERGLDLSRKEIAALVNTDPALWTRTGEAIDPRLQKASLKNEPAY
jgi:hypothetical protein